MTDICKPFEPVYPSLSLEKHRRAASKAGSIAAMTVEARKAYGNAVLEKFKARNTIHPTIVLGYSCLCASGVWDSDGASILKAVRRQQLARLSEDTYPRDFKGQQEWQKVQRAKYETAMEEKRARLTLEALAA